LAVTDWRLRRWRLWFLALMTATRPIPVLGKIKQGKERKLIFLKEISINKLDQ